MNCPVPGNSRLGEGGDFSVQKVLFIQLSKDSLEEEEGIQNHLYRREGRIYHLDRQILILSEDCRPKLYLI